MRKAICILALSVVIAGCAGTSFKWDQARQIRDGMSEKELVGLMGAPYQVRVGEDGQQLWQWVYVDLYGFSGGTKTLNIPMKDGKVTKAPAIPESFR